MASFEEEAFSRAQQMHRRTPFQQNSQPPSPKKEESKVETIPEKTPVKEKPRESHNILDSLFQNKEQSIILLLIILLMDEKADPTLLLALLYLLL